MQELIKRRYRVLGLGADDDVLAMFDQRGGEPADWVVYELGAFDRRHPASDIVAMELFGDLPSHFAVIGSSPASDAAGVDHVVKLSVIGAAQYQAGGGSAAGTARRARAARPLLGFDVRLARGADDERVPVGVAPAVADDLPHALRGSVDLDGCVKGLHQASSDPPRASSTHLAPRRHMDVARRFLRSCGCARDSRARRAAVSSRA